MAAPLALALPVLQEIAKQAGIELGSEALVGSLLPEETKGGRAAIEDPTSPEFEQLQQARMNEMVAAMTAGGPGVMALGERVMQAVREGRFSREWLEQTAKNYGFTSKREIDKFWTFGKALENFDSKKAIEVATETTVRPKPFKGRGKERIAQEAEIDKLAKRELNVARGNAKRAESKFRKAAQELGIGEDVIRGVPPQLPPGEAAGLPRAIPSDVSTKRLRFADEIIGEGIRRGVPEEDIVDAVWREIYPDQVKPKEIADMRLDEFKNFVDDLKRSSAERKVVQDAADVPLAAAKEEPGVFTRLGKYVRAHPFKSAGIAGGVGLGALMLKGLLSDDPGEKKVDQAELPAFKFKVPEEKVDDSPSMQFLREKMLRQLERQKKEGRK